MGTPHERPTQPQPGTKTEIALEGIRQGKPTSIIAGEIGGTVKQAVALVQHATTYEPLSQQQRAIRTSEAISLTRGETWIIIRPFAQSDQSPSEIQQSVLLTSGELMPLNNIHQSLKRARKEPRAELPPLTKDQRVKNLQDGHKTAKQLWQQVVPGLPNMEELYREFADILAQSGQEMPSDQTDQLRMFVYFLACKHWANGKNALLTEFAKELDRFTPEEETRLFPPMLAIVRGITQVPA